MKTDDLRLSKNGFYSMAYNTKIGRVTITADEDGVTEICFGDYGDGSENEITKKAYEQLTEYLDGKRKVFDLCLKPTGTEFQKKVWDALLKIPYGEAISYKELAVMVGNEKACRAVGGANGKNPIAIVIPCHRVIAADGTIGGYASGTKMKAKLLNIEGITIHKTRI